MVNFALNSEGPQPGDWGPSVQGHQSWAGTALDRTRKSTEE
jgi:hypothetical protein